MKKALLMEKFFAFIFAIFCLYILSGCTVTSENKKEPELSSISIKNYPDRMTFNQGEKLSFTGLVIQANYADDSKKYIPNSELQIYPPEGTVLQKVGNETIKVSYNGKSIYFDVKVIDNSSESVTLSSIIIDHESSKKAYVQGEKFNTSGISVLGVYSDGSQKTVTGWTTVPANGAVLSNTGNTTVTVTYQNCSATFTISVQEKPKIVSSSYFWGSWVRMDNGEMYEILETSVKKASREYTISSVTSDSITVSTLGTFKKESDSVMLNNNIPYFRNGGTNLDYSLKIVGFTEQGLSAQGDSSRAVSPSSLFNLSGLKGTSKSVKYKTFESNGESDENGILHLKAPTMNDVQSVTIDATDFGYGLVAIPDIMISNTGDYFGTVAIVDDDQYNLKITGTISDEQKDNGYLYGNNAKTYELALTITNISKNDCPSSYCKIEADDSRIQISSDEDVNRYVISTMKEGASKTIMLDVSFGQMTEPYVDTGIKVTLRNPSTKQEWTDYVPLRFFNGLIPITVSAKSHEKNSNAALNGFVIYPDGNNQFFSVVEGTSETVYVPTFGDKKEYMMVFSGATVSQQLSDSTELFYSVAPGSSSEKTIDLKGMSDDELDECMGRNNHSEETAVFAEKELLGYLSQGKIDYYKIKANSDENTVIHGKKVCKIQYVSDFGTVPETVKVNEGDILTASELPELSGVEGYDFAGWYVGDKKVEAGYEVTGNIVLVGKWVELSEVLGKISFKADDLTIFDNPSVNGSAPVGEVPIEVKIRTSDEGIEENDSKIDAIDFLAGRLDLTVTPRHNTPSGMVVNLVVKLLCSFDGGATYEDVSSSGESVTISSLAEKSTVFHLPLSGKKISTIMKLDFSDSSFHSSTDDVLSTKSYCYSVMISFSDDANISQISGISNEHENNNEIVIDDGFVFVEGGTFQMGSADGRDAEKPVHTVTVSNFYISPYEVTQGEYQELCSYSLSPATLAIDATGPNYPVYYVSWYDALLYCNLRSLKEGLTPCYSISGTTDPKKWPGIFISGGIYSCTYSSNNSTWNAATCNFNADGYRLPTEAEWEFAAKGGNNSQGYIYSGSNSVDDVGWYSSNRENKTHEVGKKAGNELDLYDMSGNVSEWCWDRYESYSSDSVVNPLGGSSDFNRVVRGGSLSSDAYPLRTTCRGVLGPYNRSSERLGFRLVRSTKDRNDSCTISYLSSRGTVPVSASFPKGYALSPVDLPELNFDGYKFLGWFLGDVNVSEGYVVTDNINLIAKWEESADIIVCTHDTISSLDLSKLSEETIIKVEGEINDDDMTLLASKINEASNYIILNLADSYGIELINGFNGTLSNSDYPLISVILPKGLKQVYGFVYCSNLESIVLPDGLLEISGIKDCEKLEKILIPNTVKTIGTSSFRNCTSLKSVVIPASVTKIGGMAFYQCTSLGSVEFECTTTWYYESNNEVPKTQLSVDNPGQNASLLKYYTLGEGKKYVVYWFKE